LLEHLVLLFAGCHFCVVVVFVNARKKINA